MAVLRDSYANHTITRKGLSRIDPNKKYTEQMYICPLCHTEQEELVHAQVSACLRCGIPTYMAGNLLLLADTRDELQSAIRRTFMEYTQETFRRHHP